MNGHGVFSGAILIGVVVRLHDENEVKGKCCNFDRLAEIGPMRATS
jgi:hypothetical protein